MPVILCSPELTMQRQEAALLFYGECRRLLEKYIADVRYLTTKTQVQLTACGSVRKEDIFVYFTSETGSYAPDFQNLLGVFIAENCLIWGVAMERSPACRLPPKPAADRQTFDVASRLENRSPYQDNLCAVAQIFVRKIVSQILSPLYCDEVLYFISHRRSDGEELAARLADQWQLLIRERKVYRDVVSVEVGTDAQKDIDEALAVSDVLIFLQTQGACESEYIMKELCCALTRGIPVLWIQIDDAPYDRLKIRPGETPLLRYAGADFQNEQRLTEIINEIEETCFQLLMNASSQVFTGISRLSDLKQHGPIKLRHAEGTVLGFEMQYPIETRDVYDPGLRSHYIQCFGRNVRKGDRENFCRRLIGTPVYEQHDRLFLMSVRSRRTMLDENGKIWEENYEDYLENIKKAVQVERGRMNRRIILSGAYPDCDEIYKNSLLEAVTAYAKQIIKSGYTLVFGAHPTFQELIFDIANRYSDDVHYAVEMHMDSAYIGGYNRAELEKKCTLILSDGLQAMRERMILGNRAELMVCIGGKIKASKDLQGVDIEVGLARRAGIPIALVGTVGGRSSEYAREVLEAGKWDELNPWGKELNESLYHSVNHSIMAEKLLGHLRKEMED